MFGISNTRYPVADVKVQSPNGGFYSLTRGANNMWSADGGPYNPPLIIQACHCSVQNICTLTVAQLLPIFNGSSGSSMTNTSQSSSRGRGKAHLSHPLPMACSCLTIQCQ